MKRISVFLVIVVLSAAAYGVFTVRRSFPQVSGQVVLDGLDGDVEVLRDELGVPHIYASSQHDLFFAQGYTHAQDRFWQMDFWRHIGSGRLAEMFGESQVETDMFLRSLGFEDLAEAEWAAMGSPAREILQAYADRVNAYLAANSGAEVSLEYAIVGGTESVVNAVGWSADQSYLVDWVPSQRMVIDLADLDASTFVHTTGQSGHAFHENYDSMIELWVDGVHGPMPWSREAVEAVAADRLDLVPEN